MKRGFLLWIWAVVLSPMVYSQTNSALAMSESLTYSARFNPADTRQLEILKTLKPAFLVNQLKTDPEKIAFWLNIYNSRMLMLLRDTTYEGVYLNFYTTKNTVIGGKAFSLFDIEHEFLLGGKKMKSLGFGKSLIKKDTLWSKLVPGQIEPGVIFCMYRGMYGFPSFQVVENADLQLALSHGMEKYRELGNPDLSRPDTLYQWVKPYLGLFSPKGSKKAEPSPRIIYLPTPQAVFIRNFYPEYRGVQFKTEEQNPWLKN